jgi:formate hydrogenlyase transcriptional activator
MWRASGTSSAMVGDMSPDVNARPPLPVAPEPGADQPAADELRLRLQRTLDLGLGPEHLAALVEIHRAVVGHRDRKALFTAIAQALQGVEPNSHVMLVLPGDDPSTFTVYDNFGVSGVEFRQVQTMTRAGSVVEWVLENRRPFIVCRAEDVRERFPASYERMRRRGIESMADIPLLTEGRCVGVLSLLAEQANAWSGNPPVLLDEIAASVAVAVEHCLAYEALARLRDEQAALLEINRAVARHLHRDELLATLAQCLRDVLPSDRFGLEIPVEGDRLRAHMLAPRIATTDSIQMEEVPAGTAGRWVYETRQWVIASSREELRERFPVTFDKMKRDGHQSLCVMPLVSGGRNLGVLFFVAEREAAFRELRRDLLHQVTSAVAVALDHCLAYEEVGNLRDRLARENVYLQEEIRREHPFEELVGSSPTLLAVLRKVDQVAPADTSVLILGETGTGKELIARAIHNRSTRRDRPLVKVNCTAISAGLVESELFGHVKGAFTGARDRRVGRFELADRGTIFLDEIGELPLETQVKLLRVLQEQEFEPVGSNRTIRVDVRVIAATNRDLREAVRSGRFRPDLFYRLNVFPIEVPPLRERREDIPQLVTFFLSRFARKLGKQINAVAPEAKERLAAYEWPGNVRELQNVIERAVVLSEGPVLEIDLAPLTAATGQVRGPATPSGIAEAAAVKEPAGRVGPGPPPADVVSLEEVERRHIVAALESAAGVIHGPKGAARMLKLHPNTLRSRMEKLGIAFKRPRDET